MVGFPGGVGHHGAQRREQAQMALVRIAAQLEGGAVGLAGRSPSAATVTASRPL
jgi:hypothetical protein